MKPLVSENGPHCSLEQVHWTAGKADLAWSQFSKVSYQAGQSCGTDDGKFSFLFLGNNEMWYIRVFGLILGIYAPRNVCVKDIVII